MRVENMVSSNGNKVANQFIITSESNNGFIRTQTLQSYSSTIASVSWITGRATPIIQLDIKYWDYSVTTGKYRNIFLGETKRETEKKIKSGEYILENLN